MAASLGGVVAAQDAELNAAQVIRNLADKCQEAKSFAFEGDLILQGQRGQSPGRLLAQAHVTFAVAPDRKYSLHIQPVDGDDYFLVSDGQKSWAYVPKLKQYTRQESSALAEDEEGEIESGPSASSEERDLTDTFTRMIIPALGGMSLSAESIDREGSAEVKYGGKNRTWPLIRVLSHRSESGGRTLLQLAVDPSTLAVGRLVSSNVSYSNGEKTIVQLKIIFSDFRIGADLPESTFVFDPPAKAKLVDALPLPGQTGSFLLKRPAPDFEARTLDGKRVRLSELRGKVVVLAFWASWCGPCRRELPGIGRIIRDESGGGVVVLGVNDEDRDAARDFLQTMGLRNFTTLDDASRKIHQLYRVRSIPNTFLIDQEGTVVRFFGGMRDESTLRDAIAQVAR
jgi:peroxiredoxin/outer membrane lipoprotein-sorting protein